MRFVPWFVAVLVLTLVLIGAAIATGLRGRRRQHLRLAPAALASLLATIFLAIRMGEDLTFDPLRWSVHTELASMATIALLAVVVTGIARVRHDGRHKRLAHRLAVLLGMTLLTAALVTGAWMFASAKPESVGGSFASPVAQPSSPSER